MEDPVAIIIVAPIILVIAAGVGVVKGCQEWLDPTPPPPCADYSRTMSVIRSDVAVCRWPEQNMELEKRILGKDIIHCTCPVEAE